MIRFAIRYVMPVVALTLVLDGFRAPSELTIEAATQLEVSATLEGTKRYRLAPRPYVYLVASNGQEAQLKCDGTARLCEALGDGTTKQLSVWIMEPGWFYGTWLVAAEEHGTPLVTVEQQNRIYSAAKVINTAFTLVACAVVLWAWRRRWWPIFLRLIGR